MMDTISEGLSARHLIERGEQLREREGDMGGALACFQEALKKAKDPLDISDAYGQLGLTYWHIKDYLKAKEIFLKQMRFGAESHFAYAAADANRNLGRPELAESPQDGLGKMTLAYKYAVEADRDDLVWFAHGAFGAAFIVSPSVARNWLLVETIHMFSSRTWLNKRKFFVKIVWLTGLFMDWISPWGKASIPLLHVGRVLMKLLRIPLREKQMEERIKLLRVFITMTLVTSTLIRWH